MSQIINELATIEISDDVLQQLVDIPGIYLSFTQNYQKLDDLKEFRSEHDAKNPIKRWWLNDKLRDAQLDSVEVQAEFSKTIGQLMMISIVQSKRLAEQQMQLNEQQDKLKTQADGIAEHTGDLQKQHQVLAEQSAKLENLVCEYFALKGLTEEGAQKLIEIARETKATKDSMLQEFAARAKDVELQCRDIALQMASLSKQLNDQINQNAEHIQSWIIEFQHKASEALHTSESVLRNEQIAAQQAVSQFMARLEQCQREIEASQQAKNATLESELSCIFTKLEQQEVTNQERLALIEVELGGQATRTADVVNDLSAAKAELAAFIQRQQSHQEALGNFQLDVLGRIKRLGYFAAGLSVVVIGMLIGLAYLLGWL